MDNEFHINNRENFFKKGFGLLQKAFIPSYIGKFLGYVIIVLLGALVYYILYNIWKDIDIPPNPDKIPYHLLYISGGILFIYVFISYIIDLTSEAISYYSFKMSLIGRNADFSAVKHSFKNIGNWVLIAFILLVGSAIYFIGAGLFAYRLGETGIIICVIMVIAYIVLSGVFYPILSLVMPIMVLEKRNLFDGVRRAFVLGFKNYWKSLGVNILADGVMYFITNFLVIIFLLFTKGLNLSFGFKSIMGTLSSLTVFWIMLAVYISIRSMASIIKSGLISSLCDSAGSICEKE